MVGKRELWMIRHDLANRIRRSDDPNTAWLEGYDYAHRVGTVVPIGGHPAIATEPIAGTESEPVVKQAIILQGPQGSGKSTFTRNIPNAHVCSTDDFFMVDGIYTHEVAKLKEAHGACLRKYVAALQAGRTPVVVDNTNSQRWEMSGYVQLAKAFGYEVEIHTFMIDPKVAFARNTHNVPWDTLIRTVMFMESPLALWGRHTIHLPDGTSWSNKLDDPSPELTGSGGVVVRGDGRT